MPLSKQYLRYVHSASFGIVNGRKSNVLLSSQPAAGSRERQLVLVFSPAAEDVILWDPRRGEKTAVLRGGERQEVCCVCASGDGRLLASGCEDGTVRLWNVGSREAVVSFSGHKSAVTCVQFDESGTRLVSGSKDTTVVVWDVIGGCGLYRLRGHKGPVTSCRWLNLTNTLLTGSKDCLVKLWDLDTQHCFQTLVGHKSEVWGLEVVAKETRLVTVSSDRELLVFKMSEREERGEEGGSVGEEGGSVGEKRKAVEGHKRVKVPTTCEQMGCLKRHSNERVVQLKTDPSGRLLGCLSASLLELLLVLSAEEREKAVKKKRKKTQKKRTAGEVVREVSERLTAAEEMPHFTSLSSKAKMRSCDLLPRPGNKMMVALGLHSNSIELHTLDMLATPTDHTHTNTISAPGHRTDIRAVCFSSDDASLASGSAEVIKVWNRSSRHCLHTMQSGHVLCMTFVPGDRHILAGTKAGRLQLFDIGSGDLLQDVQAHSGAVWSVDVHPDRHGVVTGSADHDVKFWDFELVSDPESTRRQLSVCHVKTLKMSEDVLCVCHSPDGRLLAVALLDTTVKIFFTDTLKFFLSLYGHKLQVLSMDISSDSSVLATCSADKNIRIWGLDYGDCHKSLFAHDDHVMGVKFVPGTHLLFSCGKDRAVKYWDADTFDHIMTLEGHCGEVWCLSVSHDGHTVVTGSHDHSLRLWEKTDEPLILSEEREREREAQFEEAVAEGGETVVPGEVEKGEVAMAGRKTLESMRAAEQLLEALAVYKEEKVKVQEWEEECRLEKRELPQPKPHPLLIAMGNITVERYVLNVVRRIKSSELDEALLVMPFSDVVAFLPLLDQWLQNGWDTELVCRCLFFLLRIHHHQIVTSPTLLPVIHSLRQHTRSGVETLRDMCGFNFAGLQSIRYGMETAGTPVFADVSEKLHKIRKKKIKTSKLSKLSS